MEEELCQTVHLPLNHLLEPYKIQCTVELLPLLEHLIEECFLILKYSRNIDSTIFVPFLAYQLYHVAY